MSEHFMDINEIQKVLINFPEIVFCNLPLAKMHDSLPINLFSLHNFLIAFDKKKVRRCRIFFPNYIIFNCINFNKYLFC